MSSTPKQNKSSPAHKDKSAPPVASSPAGVPGSVAPKTGMRRPPARKLFEADAKPFDEISTPEGRLSLRRWRVWSLVALATLMGHGRIAVAQEMNASVQTNAQPESSSVAQAGNPARPDYSTFKIIADRNIFDPSRYPRRGPRPRQRRIEFFALVGTMSYEKGRFAFFDGTSSEYKKAVKTADEIAGYRVTSIAPNSVRLTAGTNVVELPVGTQLRREEDGDWLPAGATESFASSSGSTSTTAPAAESAAAPAGEVSDIMRKLMERRAKETTP